MLEWSLRGLLAVIWLAVLWMIVIGTNPYSLNSYFTVIGGNWARGSIIRNYQQLFVHPCWDITLMILLTLLAGTSPKVSGRY